MKIYISKERYDIAHVWPERVSTKHSHSLTLNYYLFRKHARILIDIWKIPYFQIEKNTQKDPNDKVFFFSKFLKNSKNQKKYYENTRDQWPLSDIVVSLSAICVQRVLFISSDNKIYFSNRFCCFVCLIAAEQKSIRKVRSHLIKTDNIKKSSRIYWRNYIYWMLSLWQ